MKSISVKKNTIFSLLIIIFITLIVTFRGNTRDTYIYTFLFKNIHNQNLLSPSLFYIDTGIEWGFGLITYFSKIIHDSVNFLFFIVSFLTTYSIYKTSRIINVNFGIVLLAYLPTFFIVQQLMQIRQGLATSLIFLALFTYQYNRKYSILLMIVAPFIHSSALIVYPLIILLTKPFEKFWQLFNKYTVIISVLIILFMTISGGIFNDILSQYSSRAAAYSKLESDLNATRGIFNIANVREYVLLLFFIAHNKYFRKNKAYYILLLSYVLDVAVRISFRDSAIISGRLGAVFAYAEIFLFPIVLSLYFKYTRLMIIIAYFFISLYISLYIRVPYMLEDYFTPRIIF